MSWRKLWSLDHKVIGRRFIALGFLFLAVGGFLAMLIRWQLAHPGLPFPLLGRVLYGPSGGIISPAAYTVLFTMHGTVMIFFAVTPVLIGGFGSFCLPLLVGARGMSFPRLNLVSFLAMAVATLILVSSFFVPYGPASAGWTAYPPLSTSIGSPGVGQTLWTLAIYLNGVSSVLSAVNTITTVVSGRAPGMTFGRLPLSVWGLFLAAVLNALFVPVLAAGASLLFLDRVFGTKFFVAGATVVGGGDPVLYQHLFWIFGHPEVYILILPAWGIVSDLLSFFSRKPAYGYRLTVGALIAIVVLSGLVYGHHMFVVGLSPLLGESFMVLTMIISIPAVVLFVNWLGTLWRGAIRLRTPMLHALGFVFTFGLGGLTGLFLADVLSDVYLHDTYFVVGHFHLTMSSAVLFGLFAGITYWYPKIYGRMLNERLGKLHFILTFLGLNIVFCGQLVLGLGGMQRRLWNPSAYAFLQHLLPLNQWISRAAFVLGAAQLIFVFNFFWSLRRGAPAEANPWQVGTLEWQVSSPPPPESFGEIPTVRVGPHELGQPEVIAVRGRDWLNQTEEPAPGGAEGRRT